MQCTTIVCETLLDLRPDSNMLCSLTPRPYGFHPSRFLGDYNKDAFAPFYNGAKVCIGRRKGLHQLRDNADPVRRSQVH